MQLKTMKELRERKFKSQVEFAKAMNVSKSTVCGWETGTREPNIKQILQIAKLLKVSRYIVFDIFAANKND